jgi:hypothetical protein
MIFTHGIGGAADLPIPFEYALAGGAAALAVSFVVLAVAWRAPRYDAATQGRPLPSWAVRVVDGPELAWTLRVLGLGFAAYVSWAALAGPDRVTNPTFGVVYVLLWVGIVPASLLFGSFYRAVNPLRTMHRLACRLLRHDPARGVLGLPDQVGLWPAALGLFAFVWLELVSPDATYLAPVRLWFAVYAVVVLGGAVLFGDRWVAAADPFEAYSTLLGRLSVWGRTADGTRVVRSPLANLDGTPAVPGLLAVVGVLLGSTAFDSFSGSGTWVRFVQGRDVDLVLVDTVDLVAFCVVVTGLFALACMLTGVHAGTSRWGLPTLFAHSLVPIVAGYVIAHYLSYLVEVGMQTLTYLSDPLVEGANLLGTADWQVWYFLSLHQTFLAVVKVLAIVTGHVLAVISSHDRAIRLLPRRHQLTGQLPLLGVMVVYTVGGLYLLLSA